MVESKLTKVKVNNEIELCEVYDGLTKERIKKVFFREGISFFIRFQRRFPLVGSGMLHLAREEHEAEKREDERRAYKAEKEGTYVICVNKSQEDQARKAILRVVPDHQDRLTFLEGKGKKEGGQLLFRKLIAQL